VHLKLGANFTAEHAEIAENTLFGIFSAGLAVSAVRSCLICPELSSHLVDKGRNQPQAVSYRKEKQQGLLAIFPYQGKRQNRQ